MKCILILLLPFLIAAAPKFTTKTASFDVGAGNDYSVTYAPANGKEVTLQWFEGNAGENPDTTVMVLWDFGEAGETVIWSTHGSVASEVNIPIGTGDGTKKVAICLKNDDSVSRILAGKMIVVEQ